MAAMRAIFAPPLIVWSARCNSVMAAGSFKEKCHRCMTSSSVSKISAASSRNTPRSSVSGSVKDVSGSRPVSADTLVENSSRSSNSEGVWSGRCSRVRSNASATHSKTRRTNWTTSVLRSAGCSSNWVNNAFVALHTAAIGIRFAMRAPPCKVLKRRRSSSI